MEKVQTAANLVTRAAEHGGPMIFAEVVQSERPRSALRLNMMLKHNNEEPPEGLGPLTVPFPFVAIPKA